MLAHHRERMLTQGGGVSGRSRRVAVLIQTRSDPGAAGPLGTAETRTHKLPLSVNSATGRRGDRHRRRRNDRVGDRHLSIACSAPRRRQRANARGDSAATDGGGAEVGPAAATSARRAGGGAPAAAEVAPAAPTTTIAAYAGAARAARTRASRAKLASSSCIAQGLGARAGDTAHRRGVVPAFTAVHHRIAARPATGVPALPPAPPPPPPWPPPPPATSIGELSPLPTHPRGAATVTAGTATELTGSAGTATLIDTHIQHLRPSA